MRILYLSLSYVPSRRASSIQVMRTCSAYARRGHDLTLVAKRYDEPAARGRSVHAFYGVDDSFAIDLVPRPARRGGGLIYVAGVGRRLVARGRSYDLVYSRDLYGAAMAVELGLPTVFEVHAVVDLPWQQRLWRRAVRGRSFIGLVVTSNALQRELTALDMVPPHRPVIIARNATEPMLEGEPRATVSAPPRIGYIGNLYENRGLEMLPDIARRMPHCRFVLIGGSEHDLARWRAMSLPANLELRGFVAPGDLPALYRELDVLLMPYPRDGIHGPIGGADSSLVCSPMKMFEYMASGVAMVASDLAVLQEVIAHEHNALIAPAGDAAAWCVAIQRLLDDPALRVRLASRALRDLREQFTPEARASRVFDGLRLESNRARLHEV